MGSVLPGGDSPHRGAQFRHLAHGIQEFLEAGNPVLRIDTKKKACLGTLSRDGKVYCQQALKAFDHDCPSLTPGVIMPHGIDDLAPQTEGRCTTPCGCGSTDGSVAHDRAQAS